MNPFEINTLYFRSHIHFILFRIYEIVKTINVDTNEKQEIINIILIYFDTLQVEETYKSIYNGLKELEILRLLPDKEVFSAVKQLLKDYGDEELLPLLNEIELYIN